MRQREREREKHQHFLCFLGMQCDWPPTLSTCLHRVPTLMRMLQQAESKTNLPFLKWLLSDALLQKQETTMNTEIKMNHLNLVSYSSVCVYGHLGPLGAHWIFAYKCLLQLPGVISVISHDGNTCPWKPANNVNRSLTFCWPPPDLKNGMEEMLLSHS